MNELANLLMRALDDIEPRNLRIIASVVVFASLGLLITMCVSHG